jgi:hypothetical protein
MGQQATEITPQLAEWISKQHVYFVATAPVNSDGLVNCSPKGMDSFRIIDPETVGYLDIAGSGIETVAHLQENGRIVIMFCAFDGPPKIVRLHGIGTVVLPGSPGFDSLKNLFPALPGIRSIIRIELRRVSDSCGYGVPLMEFRAERDAMSSWAEKKGPEGVAAYIRTKNGESIDGLPGIR